MNLETVIRHALVDLPVYCTADVETHDWVYVYAAPLESWPAKKLTSPTRLQPHYICKHCYAVSENYTTKRYPKRAR